MHKLAGLIAILLATPSLAQTPEPKFDLVAPTLPTEVQAHAILMLSKMNGYVHASAPTARQAILDMAANRNWTIYATDNAAIFNPDQLKHFDVVVLNNTSGDLFTPDQREAFKSWIQNGGRVVAIHGAGATASTPWPWFHDTVIGARFTGHPKLQPGTIYITDRDHQATRALPPTWPRNDEWYSFDHNPRGKDTRVLATIDETTYDPTDPLRMGADHPIMWTRCIAAGGAFFTAIGHDAANWDDPVFRGHIDGALIWARDRTQPAC
ncbi:hypothetical protein ABAC460_11480 [Asticcacaulis sp. AC460]|uniref:ThuA domain-containing protein n=1 Tax=Asticcacaulis sp. AC460 TaxID=1282360 RepID=UPI0003C3FE59|nr:ThuA domain-containing protein [Asticcacaulis sp. AC460]ESQ89913.1 hypothetical protein ABAC460_11480 [Asticcacaulis sp. AC460]